MPLLFLICWIFAEMSTIIDSAPKIDYIIYNPLRNADESIEPKLILDDSTFSDGYLSDDSLNNLRTKDRSPEVIGFAGYSFDVNICKHVNGRTLCGYDKNKGEMITKSVNLGHGCFIRGERIECGYHYGQDNSKSAGNLRAKLLSTRTYTLETGSPQNTKQDETVTVKQPTQQSETSPSNNTTNFPTKPPVPVTVTSTTLESKSSESSKSEETDQQMLRTGSTTLLIKLLDSKRILNESATTKSSSSTLTLATDIYTNATSSTSLRQNRRKLDETKITTETVSPNTSVIIKNTTRKVKKYKGKKRMSKVLPKSTKVLSELTETNPTLTTTITPILDTTKQISKRIIEILRVNGTSVVNAAGIVSKPVGNPDSNSNITILRNNIDKSKVKTMCVEQKDRIICYDYQTI